MFCTKFFVCLWSVPSGLQINIQCLQLGVAKSKSCLFVACVTMKLKHLLCDTWPQKFTRHDDLKFLLVVGGGIQEQYALFYD